MSDHGAADERGSSSTALDTKSPKRPKEPGQDLPAVPSKLPATQSSSCPSSDDKLDLEPDSSSGSTQLEKPEVDKAPFSTSEAFHAPGKVSYRFRSTGPGMFLCKLTGLGFKMTAGGELSYKIIAWDEDLLEASGKLPAGPLFKIEGDTNAVSQLHLMHCELNPAPLANGLSAVHMSDEGMSFIEPLEMNDTHVFIDVSHFSSIGLVIDFSRRLENFQRAVSTQVLLFLRPNWTEEKQKVNIFILPKTIPLEEVIAHQEHAIYIEAATLCNMIEHHNYKLYSPGSVLVQPKMGSRFDTHFGNVHHPNFEIRLWKGVEDGNVVIEDENRATVWEHYMDLTGPGSGTQARQEPMRKKLSSMRKGFIERMSKVNWAAVIIGLLREEVINELEKAYLEDMQNSRDAAAELIEMVMNKGELASEVMIREISKVDKYLCDDLDSQAHGAQRQ